MRVGWIRSRSAHPAPRTPFWSPGNSSSGRRDTRTCLPPAESRGDVYGPGPPCGSVSKRARWLQTRRRMTAAFRADWDVLNEGLFSASLGSDDVDFHVHVISLKIGLHPRLDDWHNICHWISPFKKIHSINGQKKTTPFLFFPLRTN